MERSGKKVYILDATAAIFMIPIDRYNKDFDMLLKGNLGAKNELDKYLENNENVIVLINSNEEYLNWQHPKELTDRIIESWEQIGSIIRFYVYSK